MNEKLKAIANSQFAKGVTDGVKIAAFNMIGALLVKAAWDAGCALVGVAADAVLNNAEKAE